MNKKTKLIISLSICMLITPKVNAQSCAKPPSCTELGYTQTITQCAGKEMIKCPFDQTAVFCGTVYDCASAGYTETADKCQGDYVACPFENNKVKCFPACSVGTSLFGCSADNQYYDEKTGICVKSKPYGDFGCYVGRGKVAFAYRSASSDSPAAAAAVCFKKNMVLGDLLDAALYAYCKNSSYLDNYLTNEGWKTSKCYSFAAVNHATKEVDCGLNSYPLCVKDLKL